MGCSGRGKAQRERNGHHKRGIPVEQRSSTVNQGQAMECEASILAFDIYAY